MPKHRTPKRFGVRHFGAAFISSGLGRSRGVVAGRESDAETSHSKKNLECGILVPLSLLRASGDRGVSWLEEKAMPKHRTPKKIWSAAFWCRFHFFGPRASAGCRGRKRKRCRNIALQKDLECGILVPLSLLWASGVRGVLWTEEKAMPKHRTPKGFGVRHFGAAFISSGIGRPRGVVDWKRKRCRNIALQKDLECGILVPLSFLRVLWLEEKATPKHRTPNFYTRISRITFP